MDANGKITLVQWDSPAWKAGLSTSLTITTVNGEAFSVEGLKDAVAATKDGKPVELGVRSSQLTKTVKLDYAGGHRYPRLERIAGKQAFIDDILAAK